MGEQVVVTGSRSTIITELRGLLRDVQFHRPELTLGTFYLQPGRLAMDLPTDASRYVFAAGLLRSTPIWKQTGEEIEESLAVNLVSVIQMCEFVFQNNPKARICVVGSVSGECGSYDQIYAAAKAGLHRYVETRKLVHPEQQLVCVAPGIIEDSGMTQRRTDADNLSRRRVAHPKGRFLRAIEVAKMVRFLLWEDEGYTTNVIVRMEGTVCCGG